MSSYRPRSRAAQTYDLLPPERTRPSASLNRFSHGGEIEDADFTVIAEPRTIRPRSAASHAAASPGNDNGRKTGPSIPRHAVHRFQIAEPERSFDLAAGEKWLRRLSDNMFSALVALVFLIVFALAGGVSAIAMASGSGTAPVVADVTHVTALSKTVNGLPVLVVSGVIENHGEATLNAPRLRADIYSGGQLVSSTLFRTRIGAIHQGESRGFQAKLPQAGGKAPEVKVSLAQ